MSGRGLPAPVDVGLQPERTALAWDRTGLSLVAAALGVSRHALGDLGVFVLVPCALAVMCAVWLRIVSSRRTRHARASEREPEFAVVNDGRLVALAAGSMGLLCLVEAVAALVVLLPGR